MRRRLEAVEQDNRRYRRAAALAVVVAGGALVTGQAPVPNVPEEIRAKRFALVDEAGATRVALQQAPDGAAGLVLYDTGRRVRASVSLDRAGVPTMALSDATGAGRVLAVVGEGETALTLKARDGKTAVRLSADPLAPRVALADDAGTDRLWVAVRRGSPAIQFLDRQGRAMSGLATFNDDTGVAIMSQSASGSSPGIVLYGKDLKLLWSAPDK